MARHPLLVVNLFRRTVAPPFTAGFVLFGAAFFGAGSVARAQVKTPLPAPEGAARASRFAGVGRRAFFTPMPAIGMPIITFRINETTTAKFAVITESAASYVSARLVKKMGLPIEYRSEADGTRTPFVRFDKMVVGEETDSMTFVKSAFLVDEKEQALNAQTDPFYDGAIGGNVLSRFATIFDYETNQIVLAVGNLNEEQLRWLGVEGGFRAGIPLTADDKYKMTYRVPVHVGKNTYSVLLNNIRPITTVLDTDKKLKLDSAYRAPIGSSGLPSYLLVTSEFGLGESSSGSNSNGGTSLAPATWLFPSFEVGVNTSPNPSLPPVLGLDYLSRFRVIIDYPAEKLYTVPVANPARLAFPTDAAQECAVRSTDDGTLYPTKQGKWTIIRIERNGLFDKAGIQNGDVIEAINGKKTDGLRSSAVMGLFHALSYTDEMSVLRDGKPLKVTLDKH